MSDPYLEVAAITENGSMNKRVAACAAQEGGEAIGDPTQWAYDHRFGWASAPGWGAKWASAVASGIPDPGADTSVISDADVLAQLQAMAAGL